MSLEEFARVHQLNAPWVALRSECNQIVARSDYWYRKDLQEMARKLAVKASDMLVSAMKKG